MRHDEARGLQLAAERIDRQVRGPLHVGRLVGAAADLGEGSGLAVAGGPGIDRLDQPVERQLAADRDKDHSTLPR